MARVARVMARVARAVGIALNSLRLNDLARVARGDPPQARTCAHGRRRACPPGPALARVRARSSLSILSILGKGMRGKEKFRAEGQARVARVAC